MKHFFSLLKSWCQSTQFPTLGAPFINTVSPDEVLPCSLLGPSRNSQRRSKSRLLWSPSLLLLALLSQAEFVPGLGTEQCGDTGVVMAGWGGLFQHSQFIWCLELPPHKDAPCLPFSVLTLSLLESSALPLLCPVWFLLEVVSPSFLTLLPTLLPQEHSCP